MDISLTGANAGLLMLLIGVLMIGLIIYFKIFYNNKVSANLGEKYADKKWASPLQSRSKYPDVNAFSLRTPLLLFGLVSALAFTLLSFSWTTYEEDVFIPDDALELDEEIEIEPPRTAEPPPPPPPPPPPVIEEVPEEEIEEEDEPEFVDQDVEEDTVLEEPEPVVEEEAPPPPPPPPPPPEPEVEEIFKVVEQMPRFPGCEDKGSDAEKKKCADAAMLKFIYKNLKYPVIARENGVEGQAVLQFVVAKDGSVTDVKIARDPGAGCGEAAKKVVESMNNLPTKWTPGKQRGRAVKVLYTLPVKFKLQG